MELQGKPEGTVVDEKDAVPSSVQVEVLIAASKLIAPYSRR